MTTELQRVVHGTRTDEKTARRQKARNCQCGQQLDDCTRQHCPRCGRTLAEH